MAVAAADVPGKYDLVLSDGSHVNGYVTVKDAAGNQRASYTVTPTFVERANVQGDYGDNQQDFWLTFSQNDWDQGESQRYFRQDADHERRYWTGTNLNVRDAGRASIRKQFDLLSFAESITTVCGFGANLLAAGTSHLYSISSTGAITELGLHSLTTSPTTLVAGDRNAYVSAMGGNGVMKWNGSTISQFSTSPCASLAVLGNTLYGHRSSQADLVSFDTGGTLTTLFTWQDPDGSVNSNTAKVIPFGGKLLILRIGARTRNELWQWDGVGVSKLAEFPANFINSGQGDPIEIVNGVVYVSGFEATSATARRAAIYYYTNGNVGLLWRSDTTGTQAGLPMCAFDGGLLFVDPNALKAYRYDPVVGGVSSYGTIAGAPYALAASYYAMLYVTGSASNYFYPSSSTASTATVSTSLFDGDSSQSKFFRGVKVDFDAASDGNGGTVDIAYQLDTVDGSYTTLQSGATAGTEYTIGQTGRALSIKVTLNKGTSTLGPVLKRIYIRAAPVLQSFKKREYVLDLGGRNGEDMVRLRDGSVHNKDGMAMASDLFSYYLSASAPLTVTDRFGTFTGMVEPDGSQVIEQRPEVFYAHLTVREV